MSDTAGVSYRVNQLGAEGVRQRLREINDELRAGTPVTKTLNREVRDLGTSMNTQARVVKLNEQAWKQSHTTLVATGRIMSTVGSLARSALAITTAWTLATMAFGKTGEGLRNARQELELAQAQLAEAMAKGADPETIAKLEENVNRARAAVKEFEEQELQQMITSSVNMVATLALMGSGFTQMAAKIGPVISGMRTATVTTAALSPALTVASVGVRTFAGALRTIWAALGPIGLAIIALSIAIPLLIEYWPEITAAFQGFVDFMSATFGPALASLWENIKAGALGFWNGMITIANLAGLAMVKGIETIANSFVSFVNTIIDGYNTVAGTLGLGRIGRLSPIVIPFTAIPTISAATGFSGRLNQDTHFIAHKGEQVNIVPASRVGGTRGGGSGDIIINVYGDVSGEELIDKVKRSIKDTLRYDQGFTGFS